GIDVVDVHDIDDATQMDFLNYDRIIIGISTWDFGQIQSDWEEFWNDISALDFSGKTVAFFGLGDQFGYAEFFLDAMGMLHDVVVQAGATIIGHWPTDGYQFDASKAHIITNIGVGEGLGLGESIQEPKNEFVGLALDEDHQEDLTADRLNTWCKQIHTEFGLSSQLHQIDD
ncbi:MAG: flavodoxin FldA, partial [Moraxellaceae bacterium]